jgi:D-xylose transport system ATP-binding protein
VTEGSTVPSATTGTTPLLLTLKGVSKSFGANQALTSVDFEVGAGEVVALVGDNGAGKSTLVKAIAGVQLADEGEFYFHGNIMKITSPQDATRLGIATVYQDLALCDNLDVVANLYLGRELFAKGLARAAFYLDETAMEQSALSLLESLSVTTIHDVRTPVGELSGGQRQAVAIARSLLGEPSVVLLDEPTAALGVSQTEQVLELISRLRDRGLGVVVISHNLENVFAVADRIIVLRLGRRAATFDVRGVSREDVVAAITGAEFGVRLHPDAGHKEAS